MTAWALIERPYRRSRSEFDGNATFDLTRSTHILGISRQGIKRYASHVRICLRFGLQRNGRITNGSVGQAHTSVQPRPASKASDNRNRNGIHDGWTRDWT